MDHLPMMARFNAWANGRIYDSVSQLSDAAYRQDRKAFFGSIHNTLNHLLVVDRLWTGRIEGVDRGITALDQILHDDFDSLRAAREEEDRRFIELVDRTAKEGLDRPMRYSPITASGEYEARVGHVLITLLNHQTHHRGQVHVMLTQAEIDPPPLDIPVFLTEIGEAGPPGTVGAGSG